MKKWVRSSLRNSWTKKSCKVWINCLAKIKLNCHGSHNVFLHAFFFNFFYSIQETWSLEVLAWMLVTAWLLWWMYPLLNDFKCDGMTEMSRTKLKLPWFYFNSTNCARNLLLSELADISNRQTEWKWNDFPLAKGHQIQGKTSMLPGIQNSLIVLIKEKI